MQNIAAHMFIWIALGVMQLHAIIPHHHHDELGEVPHEVLHEKANTLTDVLALLFHVEMGNEEVDSVLPGSQSVQTPALHIDSTPPLDFSLLLFKISSTPTNFGYLSARLSSGYYTLTSLRGPPSQA
jgi:hypothetical protein